jgi:two-component system LytT family sensor kinase
LRILRDEYVRICYIEHVENMVKKGISKYLRSRVAVHSYLWLFYAAIMLLEPSDESVSLGRAVIQNFVFIGALIPPVYVHFFIFDRCFTKGRYRYYILLTLLAVVVFGFVNYLIMRHYHPTTASYAVTAIYIFVFVAITTAIRTAKAWYDQRFVIQEIREEHLRTELEMLKSQINPHFLFNTLNNLFGIIRKSDERAARGIATLSSLMRYMVHESNVEQIGLQKEIEQIEHFIELQKLRFHEDDDITVELHARGDTGSVALPPMLLMPFVENAFKHGISLSRPSYIIIDIDSADKALRFSVKNSLHRENIEQRAGVKGIGLQNVKRRLELLFGNNHELNIRNDGKEYEVSLLLQLQGGRP